ncbi:MAG: 16S rRNA (uracil(1498)-N(3))-methyltransferase [Rhodospirillales bacterium]|nr:16S rRNA (uracil(1498)-N(3))-methyltransferase [Rhodospirillales bacterium]
MAGPEREREDGRSAIRLFVESSLAAGAAVTLTANQAHYLRNVMRQAQGARVRLFNGRDGEWEGTIETLAPSRATVRPVTRLAVQPPAPDLRLLFAPLKSERTRFVVEKATELGIGAIHPVLTRYGQTRRVNLERLRAHAIEAAEQCGRLEVPHVASPCSLTDALADWPAERRLLVCDPEAPSTMAEAVEGDSGVSWAILIGPEGGFAPAEKRLLADHPAAVHARLGPRILRAETAVAAALACWQALAGDWR